MPHLESGKRETNSNFLPREHAPSLFADANLDASILSNARYGYKLGRGGEGAREDRGKTRNAAESFVADYRSIFEQVQYSLSLSLWKSFFFFFTTTTTTTAILSQIRATFLSPRKNPFSGARYVRRRGSSGALPPPSALHPSSLFSALYPLRDS